MRTNENIFYLRNPFFRIVLDCAAVFWSQNLIFSSLLSKKKREPIQYSFIEPSVQLVGGFHCFPTHPVQYKWFQQFSVDPPGWSGCLMGSIVGHSGNRLYPRRSRGSTAVQCLFFTWQLLSRDFIWHWEMVIFSYTFDSTTNV